MMITRSALLIASLCTVPALGAFAQSSNPHDAGGVAGSQIAKPTYPPGQNANPALTGKSGQQASNVPAAENPQVPGATGRTVVPGDRSKIGSDSESTVRSKTSGAGTSDGASGGR